MPTPLIRKRWGQLIETIPELLDESKPKSILYVGANKYRHHYMPELFQAGHKITVLEVWEPYAEEIVQKEMVSECIVGSAVDADSMPFTENMFDITLWWHGPEHVDAKVLPLALFRLERITRDIMILGTPWGAYPQGEVRGNPYEAHVNQLYPPAFHELGYKTKTLGEIDTIDSNVLAYKRLRHRRSRRRIDDFSKWMEDLSKVNVG